MKSSNGALWLLVVAAAFRLVYLIQSTSSPFFDFPIVDAAEYVARARAILTDGIPWAHVSIHGPMYPLWVASIFAISGGSFLLLYLLQHVLGLATLWILYRMTEHSFGKTVAVVSLGLSALTWVPIYFEGQALSESLLAFLVAAGCSVLLRGDARPRLATIVAAGLVWGAAVLTRANVLALLPIVALWIALGAGRRSLLHALTFVVVVAVVVTPVTWQNRRAEGDFVLIQANGGFNLFLGLRDGAQATHTIRPGVEWRRFLRVGEREAPEGPGARDRYWTNQAVAAAMADPLRVAGLVVERAFLFLTNAEIGTSQDPNWHRENFGGLGLLPFGMGWMMVAALFGFVVAVRRAREDRASLLFAALAFMYVASLLLFPYFSRYRYPGLAIFAALAGLGCREVWGALRDVENPLRRAGVAASVLGLLAIAHWDPFRLVPPDIVRVEYQLGRAAGSRGDWPAAVEHYQSSLRDAPNDPDVRNNLGLSLEALGRPDDARREYLAAIALAPDHTETLMNLAAMARARGELSQAVGGYEEAVRHDPAKFDAWNALGTLYIQENRHDEALRAFEVASRLRTTHVYAADMYGRLLLRANEVERARVHFEKVRRYPSTRVVALVGLARLEAARNRFGEARSLLEEAISLEPDHASARELLGRLDGAQRSR